MEIRDIANSKMVSERFLKELLDLMVKDGETEESAMTKMMKMSNTALYQESVRLGG